MAGPKAAWGIDMGQCGMKAIKVRLADQGKVEALAAEYIEHPRILSQPDADRPAMIREALERFLANNEMTKDPIVVSVPGQHTLARFSKLPPVEKKKIPDIVRFEAGQQIPFDIDDVIWDYQTFTEENSLEISVGIFAMRRELIGDYLLHYANAGIEPAIVQSNPLSLYNALYFDGRCQDSKATVIIDIGAENTDLIIAENKALWTRTIPIGGNTFTEALVKAFKLKFSKAENLKRTAATSKYARQVFQAMRPVFADLVAEVQRSIGFYSSTHRGSEIGRIIAMGNAFKLPGLQKFLQQNLGVEVKRPSNFKNLDVTSSTNSPLLVENLLSFGVAYGLALQGLGLTHITSNLLPPEIAKQVIWRKKRPWFVATAACLVATASVIWARNLFDSRALAANQQVRAETQRILREAERLRGKYDDRSGEGDAELDRIDNILSLGTDTALWLNILDVIHSALPPWQDSLKMETANTPEAYRTAAAGVDRKTRQQIFIERMKSTYYDQVGQAFSTLTSGDQRGPADWGRQSQAEAGQAPQDYPGFIIEIEGTTPNANGPNFLETRFQESLKKLGRKPGSAFFIHQAEVTTCVQISDLAVRGVPSITPPRQRGDRTTGSSGTKKEPATVATDIVTQEEVGTDYRFTMLVAIALGEPPAVEPPEDAPAESPATRR